MGQLSLAWLSRSLRDLSYRSNACPPRELVSCNYGGFIFGIRTLRRQGCVCHPSGLFGKSQRTDVSRRLSSNMAVTCVWRGLRRIMHEGTKPTGRRNRDETWVFGEVSGPDSKMTRFARMCPVCTLQPGSARSLRFKCCNSATAMRCWNRLTDLTASSRRVRLVLGLLRHAKNVVLVARVVHTGLCNGY